MGVDATGNVTPPPMRAMASPSFSAPSNTNTIFNSVISGNEGSRIRLDGSNFPVSPGASGNAIQDNKIGTNAAGAAGLGTHR